MIHPPPSTVYAKYLEEIPCHVCGGTKLRKEVLEYKIGGLNYADIESMELTAFAFLDTAV